MTGTVGETSDPARYRPGVGLVLFNRQGLVFAGCRKDLPTAWQMPQGGIDDDEEPERAALRELHEEIGTSKAEIVARTGGWLHYDLPTEIASKIWRGQFRGQRQIWFALKFLGNDDDIDLDATDHPEFIRWRWMRARDLEVQIVAFKRNLYCEVFRIFRNHLA